MSKKQIAIRASDATREQLAYLAKRYGTVTTAVAVAVAKLYESEKPTDK